MVKSYLRYVPSGNFGIIASPSSNSVFDPSGKLVISPALEDVILWDMKMGTMIARWHDKDNSHQVTCISSVHPISSQCAVGYEDGSIRIWNIKTHQLQATFNGHKSAVTVIVFDVSATYIASGSKDTDIVVWDVVAESGVCRLRGHKDQITSLCWLPSSTGTLQTSLPDHLISTSKDTLIKVWDLTVQHSVETIVGHQSEIWSAAMLTTPSTDLAPSSKPLESDQLTGVSDESQSCTNVTLVTGSADAPLKVWRLDWNLLHQKSGKILNGAENAETLESDNSSPSQSSLVCVGEVARLRRERVGMLQFDPSGRYLACQSVDKTVELFLVATPSELKKKVARRLQRLRKKSEKHSEVDSQLALSEAAQISIQDKFSAFKVIRASVRPRSIDFSPMKTATTCALMIATVQNSIEVFHISNANDASDETPSVNPMNASIQIPGHRHDVRSVALSSNDEMILSAASGSLKIWNTQTGQCVRTLPSTGKFPLCSLFVPGDRHAIVGTKTGELEVYDVWSCTLLESIKAHEGALWSIDLRPNQLGLVSGSADKQVKFWDFGAVDSVVEQIPSPSPDSTATKQLAMIHMRTLQMSDEILCLKHSPDMQKIAVSLMDSTVKIFQHDSLKFCQSLYGHKLPVMAIDISSDNQLLISASADKNIKIWGLDFGDCHKSIFAHTDSIMQVRFLPSSHHFFSCSKDQTLKYWDGDKFQMIQHLRGHHGEVWAMAVGQHGQVVVSSGHDKSIRVWQRSDEQLFLDEERDTEAERDFDAELVKDAQSGADEGGEDAAVAQVGKKSVETLKDGEKILEAVEFYQHHHRHFINHKNPVLVAMGDITVERYVFQVLERVRSANLHEALTVLPFTHVPTFFLIIELWVQHAWSIQLATRTLMILLKLHHPQLVASRNLSESTMLELDGASNPRTLRTIIDAILKQLRTSMNTRRHQIGFNMAALKFLRRQWELDHVCDFLDWETEMASKVQSINENAKSGSTKKKRKVAVAVAVTVGGARGA